MRARIQNNQKTKRNNGNVIKKAYLDQQVCFSVPNARLITRSGGRPAFHGNSMLMHHGAFPGIDHDLQQVTSQFLCVPPWKVDHQRAIVEHEARMREEAQAQREADKADKKALKAAEHARKQAEKAAAAAAKKAARIAAHEAKNAAAAAGGKKARKKKVADALSVVDGNQLVLRHLASNEVVGDDIGSEARALLEAEVLIAVDEENLPF
jgi:hypothetical protein